MAEFVPAGSLTSEAAHARMLETTTAELSRLTTDPAFQAWQHSKAARENRARTLTNCVAVASCLLLLLTMALLKPAASGPAAAGAAASLHQVRARWLVCDWLRHTALQHLGQPLNATPLLPRTAGPPGAL